MISAYLPSISIIPSPESGCQVSADELCIAHEGHCIGSYSPLTNSYDITTVIPKMGEFGDGKASSINAGDDFWFAGYFGDGKFS